MVGREPLELAMQVRALPPQPMEDGQAGNAAVR